MDWLKGMNEVARYIEDHLTDEIFHGTLAQIVGVSAHEFSRIFAFMAGMSLSAYIRRRRLTQAAFDIQKGGKRVIDVALSYGYESPATFSRAFRELHGTTPSSARKAGTSLRTYPPISFILTIRGANGMDYRIEKRDAFQIMGLSGYDRDECEPGKKLTPLWETFMESYDARLWNGGRSFYTPPFWQVGAYAYASVGELVPCIIGAEFKGLHLEGMAVERVPAATWAVFTFNSPTGVPYVPEAYARIVAEWLPASGYEREEAAPLLEVFPAGNSSASDYRWEIWMPIIKA